MQTDLMELVEQVDDAASFVEFVLALAMDKHAEDLIEEQKPSSPFGPGALGWENGSIVTFLECASAWGQAQLEQGTFPSEANPWRVCAKILFAGKYYE